MSRFDTAAAVFHDLRLSAAELTFLEETEDEKEREQGGSGGPGGKRRKQRLPEVEEDQVTDKNQVKEKSVESISYSFLQSQQANDDFLTLPVSLPLQQETVVLGPDVEGTDLVTVLPNLTEMPGLDSPGAEMMAPRPDNQPEQNPLSFSGQSEMQQVDKTMYVQPDGSLTLVPDTVVPIPDFAPDAVKIDGIDASAPVVPFQDLLPETFMPTEAIPENVIPTIGLETIFADLIVGGIEEKIAPMPEQLLQRREQEFSIPEIKQPERQAVPQDENKTEFVSEIVSEPVHQSVPEFVSVPQPVIQSTADILSTVATSVYAQKNAGASVSEKGPVVIARAVSHIVSAIEPKAAIASVQPESDKQAPSVVMRSETISHDVKEIIRVVPKTTIQQQSGPVLAAEAPSLKTDAVKESMTVAVQREAPYLVQNFAAVAGAEPVVKAVAKEAVADSLVVKEQIIAAPVKEIISAEKPVAPPLEIKTDFQGRVEAIAIKPQKEAEPNPVVMQPDVKIDDMRAEENSPQEKQPQVTSDHAESTQLVKPVSALGERADFTRDQLGAARETVSVQQAFTQNHGDTCTCEFCAAKAEMQAQTAIEQEFSQNHDDACDCEFCKMQKAAANNPHAAAEASTIETLDLY